MGLSGYRPLVKVDVMNTLIHGLKKIEKQLITRAQRDEELDYAGPPDPLG